MPTAPQLAQARKIAATFCTAAVTITRIDDAEITYVDGKLVTAPGTIVYSGCASISDRRDSRPADWGGLQLAAGQWLLRAPLDAQTVQPGDLVHVDQPGDYPGGTRDLWVHEILGRQSAVLARLIVSTTRPGDVHT